MRKLLIISFFWISGFNSSIFAQDNATFIAEPQSATQGAVNENVSGGTLEKVLVRLGEYLGYNLYVSVPTFINTLMDFQEVQILFPQIIPLMLGSTLVDMPLIADKISDPNLKPPKARLGPGDDSQYVNKYINQTFGGKEAGNQPYFINTTIDQSLEGGEYAKDPVTQAVLNILSTSDISVNFNCLTDKENSNKDKCKQSKSLTEVLSSFFPKNNINNGAKLPGRFSWSNPNYNAQVANVLNANALIGPLEYNENAESDSLSQRDEALKFIRYAIYGANPINLMDYTTYNSLLSESQKKASSSDDLLSVLMAQTNLANYLISLRVFAAQASVGISNLFYLFSQRVPQKVDRGNSSSLAFMEYYMATRRINNLDNTNGQSEWLNTINQASAATVQKEIAVLLAEINYQLYLNRKLEERILLTNSITLLQNTRATEPGVSNISSSNVKGP